VSFAALLHKNKCAKFALSDMKLAFRKAKNHYDVFISPQGVPVIWSISVDFTKN